MAEDSKEEIGNLPSGNSEARDPSLGKPDLDSFISNFIEIREVPEPHQARSPSYD